MIALIGSIAQANFITTWMTQELPTAKQATDFTNRVVGTAKIAVGTTAIIGGTISIGAVTASTGLPVMVGGALVVAGGTAIVSGYELVIKGIVDIVVPTDRFKGKTTLEDRVADYTAKMKLMEAKIAELSR